MKRATATALIIGGAAAAAAAIAVILAVTLSRETTFTFSARDSVSGRWVWDLTARLQGREIRSFFQSDTGPIPFRFSRLAPGKAVLTLSAPSYDSVEIPVSLRRGVNRLAQPVQMLGREIPGLSHFVIFENLTGQALSAQLRPVGTDGKAVLNHPCMDLRIGARISIQMHGGVPSRAEAETGNTRGAELFRGKLGWEWDPAPETVFRYTASIPLKDVKDDPSLYRVIDYIIVVPDPAKIAKAELDALWDKAWAAGEAGMAAVLDAEKGRVRYFRDTSWNVAGRQE
jgi:hypothetical protein